VFPPDDHQEQEPQNQDVAPQTVTPEVDQNMEEASTPDRVNPPRKCRKQTTTVQLPDCTKPWQKRIRDAQQATEALIPFAPFSRAVRFMLPGVWETTGRAESERPIKMQRNACKALQVCYIFTD
jgi:hypothetical protein